MKPLRIFVASLFMLCLLAVPQTAKAQSGGSIVVSTQILYDDQTGYVLAEGRAALYTGFAEVLTGGRWQVRLELDGPNGFVGSAPGYMYLNGGSYAYVDTYVDESGYGDYNAYTTVSMMAGAVDYLGFYYFGDWQQGFEQLTVGGGPYYPGMPCYDEWLGFYMDGPCYPAPPAPYLEQPAEIAMSMDSRTIERRPTQVKPIATADQGQDGTNGLPSCADLGYPGKRGWIRNVTNQLQYRDGSAYRVSGVTMADTIAVQAPNALNVSGTKVGSAETTGDGSFPDTYLVCSTACPSSSGTAQASQSWTYNSSPLSHVNQITYACSYISIDGNMQ